MTDRTTDDLNDHLTDHRTDHLTELGSYHVRHAGPSAARAAADIAGLLEAGVTLVDVSHHDRHADVVTLRATTDSTDSTDREDRTDDA